MDDEVRKKLDSGVIFYCHKGDVLHIVAKVKATYESQTYVALEITQSSFTKSAEINALLMRGKNWKPVYPAGVEKSDVKKYKL